MNKKLSVIIPAYNAEKTIQKCVDSVSAAGADEIIIMNDGSTDNTLKIAKGITSEKIKIGSIGHSGVSTARNLAMQIATGDYITFVDADDYILGEDFYKFCIDKMVSRKLDILLFGRANSKGETFVPANDTELISNKQAILEMFKGKMWRGYVTDKIYRRDLLSCVQFDSRIRFGEDLLFNWKALRMANRIGYKSRIGYYHKLNGGSVTNDPEKRKDISKVCDLIFSTTDEMEYRMACQQMVTNIQEEYK